MIQGKLWSPFEILSLIKDVKMGSDESTRTTLLEFRRETQGQENYERLKSHAVLT